MKHIFEQGMSDETIILLHGTGGDETDLLLVGEFIDPAANLLGIKGNILENGIPRFFRRISMGVFDEESLIEETHNLKNFIDEAIEKYEINRDKMTILGYSNGANILASLLFFYPDFVKKAILLHAMVPIRHIEIKHHQETKIFLSSGKEDPLVLASEVLELKKMFEERNITCEHYESAFGHALTEIELRYAKRWYDKIK